MSLIEKWKKNRDLFKLFDKEEGLLKKIEADLRKVIDEMSNADEIWSKSQKKMINPWSVEGCAVIEHIKQKIGLDDAPKERLSSNKPKD